MRELRSHIVLLSGLLLLSVLLATVQSGDYPSGSGHKDRFIVQDTSKIQGILIEKPDKKIKVERRGNAWLLNDTFKTDPALIKIFNAVMSQVQVARPVSAMNFEEVKADLLRSGQKVTVTSDSKKIAFYSGGNTNKTQAYFADENLQEIYLVQIPGYNHYLSGIFELSLNQWRDRLLFESSWRSIQSLNIDYLEGQKENLDIRFEIKFMKVKDVIQLDTTKLMTYLSQFERFQVNDYLDPGQFPTYDSLLQTDPMVVLELRDIDKSKNRSLRIFNKINDQRFFLFADEENQMIVIDEKRVDNLLKIPDFFKSNGLQSTMDAD